MKKLFFVLAVVAVAAAAVAFLSSKSDKTPDAGEAVGLTQDKVGVIYFHLTRRCVTCQAVENVARDAVGELYPAEAEKGTVVFSVLNIEDKSSEADARRVNATGQCLLVVSGDSRIDLTGDAFMYARNDPGKLKEEIRKAVDPLLTALTGN